MKKRGINANQARNERLKGGKLKQINNAETMYEINSFFTVGLLKYFSKNDFI